jgi:uncharacterized protein
VFVGVLRLELSIPAARTLKDRRNVVRSFRDRLLARLRVSIAEIGELEDPQRATLGVAVVSNDRAVCDRILADVASFAGHLRDAVLTGRALEIVSFGRGGANIRAAAGLIEDVVDEDTTIDETVAKGIDDLRVTGMRPKAGKVNLWTDDDE